MITKLTVASFFAGIGGFDLGFERAGFETIYQCELDEYCRNILGHHWPHVKREIDIKEVQVNAIPKAEVWCAGFPCQDVSLARARPRAGLKGERTGLFYRFADLLSGALPPFVVLENVPGLLNSHEGRDFGIVIQTLAELGYGVGWRVLNSRFFGVPQSRQRVYIIGCHNDPGRAAQILFEPECGARHLEKSGESGKAAVSPFMERAERVGSKAARGKSKPTAALEPEDEVFVPKLSFCLAATTGRHTGTDWSRTYVAYKDRARRLTPSECEGLQGFPTGWTMPDALFEQSDDIDSLRYHALGNAVSVPVTEWVATRIHRSIELDGLPSITAKPVQPELIQQGEDD
jgi:DNA (cytosine-5)-methyltransferase 1